MKEFADFLVALGKLLAALDRGAGQEQPAQPVTDCNQLPAQDGEPAAETVTDCHHLPEAPAAEEPATEQKPKKKSWTCVCKCQNCGAEFRSTHRKSKCCPACLSAIRSEHMRRIRQAYMDKMQQPAPQEDAGTEPAAGGE